VLATNAGLKDLRRILRKENLSVKFFNLIKDRRMRVYGDKTRLTELNRLIISAYIIVIFIFSVFLSFF
jgi:hypothetical protein